MTRMPRMTKMTRMMMTSTSAIWLLKLSTCPASTEFEVTFVLPEVMIRSMQASFGFIQPIQGWTSFENIQQKFDNYIEGQKQVGGTNIDEEN